MKRLRVACRMVAVVAAVAAGLLAGGCRKQAPAGRVVGLSNIGSESAWHTAFVQSVEDEARQRGVELKYADAQVKQANQIKAVRSFIAQKVDVIVLVPIVKTGWDSVLAEARQAGIPVLLVGRAITARDAGLYVTLISSDFIEEGQRAAAWLASQTGGQAAIVELEGTAGADAAIDRKKGFDDEIAKHPGMKIIASQTADFTRAKGKEVMEALIKSQGKAITAVYAHNDDMALGAIQALDEAGMNPGKDVRVVSVDAVKAAFDAILAGKLNASVECTPLMGPVLFDTIDKVLAGQKVPPYIKNLDALFDQSNAARFADSRKY